MFQNVTTSGKKIEKKKIVLENKKKRSKNKKKKRGNGLFIHPGRYLKFALMNFFFRSPKPLSHYHHSVYS